MRFASRDGFAHLHALKGFEDVVRSAVARARAAGDCRSELDQIERSARGFDAVAEPERRTALRELATQLSRLSELPEELRWLAEVKEGAVARPRRRRAAAKKAAPAKKKTAEAVPDEPPVAGSGILATPLKSAARLSPRLSGVLTKKGLKTVGDVLFLFPRAYQDRRRIAPIAEARVGERCVVVGRVLSAGAVYLARGRRMFRAVIDDGSGRLTGTWFHVFPWMKERYRPGARLLFSGEVREGRGVGREIVHPETELAEDLERETLHFGRVVPVYPGFERAEQRGFRELAHKVLAGFGGSLRDPLPPELLERLKLPGLVESLLAVHFPEGELDLGRLEARRTPQHRRLAFEELFFLQLGLALRRQGARSEPGIAFSISEDRVSRAIGRLPFALTGAQRQTLGEILDDMAKPEPMNRLLQGDVGSGKTAVALVAALIAIENGYQVALMAPTEILAEQHYALTTALLRDAGVRPGLFISSSAAARREARRELASGEIHLAIGTHALIQEGVEFKSLGLVVVDEQHRFGVAQRAKLIAKTVRPDVLVMTATPIPRTLAMTVFGDLDVSVISELPPGRTPVATRVFQETQRGRAYHLLGQELAAGRQGYVVYPLVEESEKVDLADATRGLKEIEARFPEHKVGLLHGRMKGEEKEAIMAAYRRGHLRVLVCTTVVEVGVDVPNATVMLVEGAERFGLAQLHQLRGRVGRGSAASHCLLIAKAREGEALERLAIMEKSNDGFAIAEKDLELRGPGELMGARQSGMPSLSIAEPGRDAELLATARREAFLLAESDPKLSKPEHALLRQALDERWGGKLGLATVG